ncbi:MAG: hypothetical protein AMDU3_IPLC00004G0002 [Thermoplasmatales archaeon I-plasma]|nr:MAG: hypothetical protein AMDU3_IPLC00004G0002 [Thermoplasmatales archaeon I-plasma]
MKRCRNCDRSFEDYQEFKEHIRECNRNKLTIGDLVVKVVGKGERL